MMSIKKLGMTIRCPSCGAGSSIVLEKDGEEYCLACHVSMTKPGKKLER